MGKGIDYGLGLTNIDRKTGIRYGVISQNEVLQAWADASEPDYGKPECAECPECGTNDAEAHEWGDEITCSECGHEWELELPDFAEPLSYSYSSDGYKAVSDSAGDIFVMKSRYYTRAQFCSPCAPGACYLTSPCEDGEKAYCFGHDWFEDNKAPYPVYRVADNMLIPAGGES